MRDPSGFMREEYQTLVEKGFDWKLRVLEGPSAPRCRVDGKDVIMLCSNNYLNLSNHPRLKQAAKEAIDTHGVGSGSVRPIAGNMDLHIKVEKKLAEFKRTESSLIYQTGFAASMLMNTSLFRHSSLNLPLKLSMYGFSQGLPACM